MEGCHGMVRVNSQVEIKLGHFSSASQRYMVQPNRLGTSRYKKCRQIHIFWRSRLNSVEVLTRCFYNRVNQDNHNQAMGFSYNLSVGLVNINSIGSAETQYPCYQAMAFTNFCTFEWGVKYHRDSHAAGFRWVYWLRRSYTRGKSQLSGGWG